MCKSSLSEVFEQSLRGQGPFVFRDDLAIRVDEEALGNAIDSVGDRGSTLFVEEGGIARAILLEKLKNARLGVIVDDTMPNAAGVFDTWIFGPMASRWGVGNPKVPAEVDRDPEQGNGGGGETLFSRIEWSMLPVGHNFLGGSVANPDGGPTNTEIGDGVNNWARTFPERKQSKAARLVTTEF